MPIKHVHKSLASVNEKTFFISAFLQSQHIQKKKKKPFSMSTLFVELISILVNASIYFNYVFDAIFFILAHNTIVKLKVSEVRQASKSTNGTLHKSFEIMGWSVNTLIPRKMQL